MQLFGALVLFTALSTACGLRCYTCTTILSNPCTKTESCPVGMDRCASGDIAGFLFGKGCVKGDMCDGRIECCEGDLCNSATLTGPSVILLLVSSAIITLFL
ncbi:unnamed protein product [Pleuronectes platessa]|uniref:UPAR/Ly6 domain-containing protein n=1 Tax=Pleuronectes platessa TaxID=8262 RepID=A0A9N7YS32_PLEPL|nr:unnamed protein product [Pleuronectes platessa]